MSIETLSDLQAYKKSENMISRHNIVTTYIPSNMKVMTDPSVALMLLGLKTNTPPGPTWI